MRCNGEKRQASCLCGVGRGVFSIKEFVQLLASI